MNELDTKRAIVDSLTAFGTKPLADAGIGLFESLGYKSPRHIALKPNTPKTFTDTFAKDKSLNPDQALIADWQSVDFLFQLTDEEIRAAAQGNHQFLFEGHGCWNGAEINSFIFLAIVLAKPEYTRTQLSTITRAVNRLFPMPAILIFQHGDTLTLAIISRRLHKRDESKDVLEKVTLIKDIRFANPHRAHVEILFDLSFGAIHEKYGFSNFVALQSAWQKTLDSSELNKRFFQEIANWYFWALNYIQFPAGAPKQDGKDHISVIRLITRLMFCWFVKEKKLISDLIFRERDLSQILNGFEPTKITEKRSVFYKAILQNLFFATLNTEMDKRGWTKEEQNFMAHSLYRHRELFQNPSAVLAICSKTFHS
jgi:adenine-specific DNA-methyltransferase